MKSNILNEITRLRNVIDGINEQREVAQDYKTFESFLHSEYGKMPTSQEVAEAIINWAGDYMMGLNTADYQGVVGYIDEEVYGLIKNEASDYYMKTLEPLLNLGENG